MKITSNRAVESAVGNKAHHEAKLIEELKWLESNIANIRHSLESGSVFEDLNLVKNADVVARRTAKVQMMRDIEQALEAVADEQ